MCNFIWIKNFFIGLKLKSLIFELLIQRKKHKIRWQKTYWLVAFLNQNHLFWKIHFKKDSIS